MNYTTGQVMQIFDVSRETVRNWATEFASYLSVTAKPGKGRHRQFTEDDMQVFALIAEMKNQGAVYEDIHASLNTGQRGEPPQIDFNKLAKSEQHQQIAMLQTALVRLQTERDRAVTQLQEVQNDLEQQRGMVMLLKEQFTEKDEQIKELYLEIAMLRAQVDNSVS